MGGMGFIETHKAECMISVLINTHMLMAARDAGCRRYFYSSSACVYAADKQTRADVAPLREGDAYPAMPEDGYGWEKLFSERMCRHFREDFGLETRIARYHNVYGPHGTYDGGREKAPAAICRKIIAAQLAGETEIEVWGDGEQSRSFMYIDDCLHGTRALLASDVREPINIGSDELVTINQLIDIVEDIAGVQVQAALQAGRAEGRARPLQRQHADQARSSAGRRRFRLRDGMERTYRWISRPDGHARRQAPRVRLRSGSGWLIASHRSRTAQPDGRRHRRQSGADPRGARRVRRRLRPAGVQRARADRLPARGPRAASSRARRRRGSAVDALARRHEIRRRRCS